MAILVAEKNLETETSCWYKFVCDTASDIATLPTSQTTGTSYRVKKTARPTSIAYCVGEARLYMLDSNDKWRALYGLSDDVLDALGKSAKELLAICKETEGYRDSASESAAAAAASESAAAESETNAKASENAASGSQAAAAQSESNAKASENASKSSENASAKSEKNAKASEIAAAASQDAAKISETNAASSEGAAAASQSAAARSESNAKSSETKAKSSEDAALASQNAAKSSEQKSASSEAAAKSSEEAAKASENAAAASETAAAQSESNAADSQAAALASENAAAASQAAASSSEGAAKSSENKAAESASASASSASASATSANNSENSATRSDSSAAAAKKSETNAAASERAAASSAAAALASEQNSSSSAASAAASAKEAQNAVSIDSTLSIKGSPADAKATGDALKGKSDVGHTHNLSTMINGLSTGESTPVDSDYYVSQYVGGGTSTPTYHRRPMSALWSYIKGKTDSVYTTKTVTNSIIKAYDITLATSGWKATSNTAAKNAGWAYQCDATVSGCTAALEPSATVSLESVVVAQKAGLGSICETSAGYCRFYAEKVPAADISLRLLLTNKNPV